MDQHGRTNWSTGFKLQVEVDDDEKEYFLKAWLSSIGRG